MSTDDQPQPQVVRPDAHSLRGLAHPIRLRMLGILRADGPATATKLAERLGLNSGATSYHLRQLAVHGFIVEDTERGTGRDRWWRAAHQSTDYDESIVAGEQRELGAAFLRGIVQVYTEHMLGAIEELPTLPAEWRGAGTMSDYILRLTPGDLRLLVRDVAEVVRRYQSDDPDKASEAPADAASVVFQVQAFPRPGVLRPVEEP